MSENVVTEAQLQEQVRQANSDVSPLCIKGNNTKLFLGHEVKGDELDMSACSGILKHEPSELFIRARAGTPLHEIETVLSNASQMLAFEPPDINRQSTLGGTIATAISGPRRPFTGSVRDYVLGMKCINGRGDILNFGGQVIKNVAGYDISRLMTGAYGTLGLILEVTLKVMPKPTMEFAFKIEMEADAALEKMHEWMQQPLPLSACCYDSGFLKVRISADEKIVMQAALSMELDDEQQMSSHWFTELANFQTDFFKEKHENIWRLSLPSNSTMLDVKGDCLIDWGGAQRWLKTNEDADRIRALVSEQGGHATLVFSSDEHIDRFHPLQPGIKTLHKNLKRAFDPDGILNPGRMYRDI